MEFEKVRDIIVETLGCDAEQVTLEASLADDLGADSLASVELVMALEEATGISIDDADVANLKTVNDILTYLNSPQAVISCPAGGSRPRRVTFQGERKHHDQSRDFDDLMDRFERSTAPEPEAVPRGLFHRTDPGGPRAGSRTCSAGAPRVCRTGCPCRPRSGGPGSFAEETNTVTAPLVGTFYAAPAPDQAPFVAVGDRVKKGQTVCLIEAMKMMSEVPAPVTASLRRSSRTTASWWPSGSRCSVIKPC